MSTDPWREFGLVDVETDQSGQLVRADLLRGATRVGVVTSDDPGHHDYAIEWVTDDPAAQHAFAAHADRVGVSTVRCRECVDCDSGGAACGICADPVAAYVYGMWERERWNMADGPVYAADGSGGWVYTAGSAGATRRWDWPTQQWLSSH